MMRPKGGPKRGALDGLVIWARQQHAGRGRLRTQVGFGIGKSIYLGACEAKLCA